jgi:hypothetical protein
MSFAFALNGEYLTHFNLRFLVAQDTAYVVIKNLKALLMNKNPNEAHYIGRWEF